MDKLVKYQQVAIQKGGQLVSTSLRSGKKLEWRCNEGHTFWLTVYKVHRRGQWCKQCGSSIGEREIRKVFRDFNIPFQPQVTLQMLPRRKYDFYFEYNAKRYLIEFDGEQHFRFVRKYHKTKAKFLENQLVDRIKTYAAWNSGYHFIRIDCGQIDYIRHHIINAINSGVVVYLSDPQMYSYITNIGITQQQWQQYA